MAHCSLWGLLAFFRALQIPFSFCNDIILNIGMGGEGDGDGTGWLEHRTMTNSCVHARRHICVSLHLDFHKHGDGRSLPLGVGI